MTGSSESLLAGINPAAVHGDHCEGITGVSDYFTFTLATFSVWAS
jgi:hypothetical protein